MDKTTSVLVRPTNFADLFEEKVQKEVQEAEAKLETDKANTEERKKKGFDEHAIRKRNEEQLHELMDRQIEKGNTDFIMRELLSIPRCNGI